MSRQLIKKATDIFNQKGIPVLQRLTMMMMALNVDGNLGQEVMEQVHKPQNALLHQKMQDGLLVGINPLITSLIEEGIEVNRFELYLTRQSLHLNSFYRERTPADCKFLQQVLTNEWGIDLPVNMMPMSKLEAIVGAILAMENNKNPDNIKQLFTFRGQRVIDVKTAAGVQKPLLVC